MFKKILFSTGILVISSSNAFAYLFDNITVQNCAFTNVSPYIGVNGEYNKGPWKVKNSSSVNLFTHGYKRGLFAGISGRICPGLYLATEIFGNKGSVTSNFKVINSAGTIGKATSTYDYGISFISGYMFSPGSILYARMGFILANIDWMQNPGLNGPGEVSSVSKVAGAQFGFGYQQCIIRNVFIRAEYDFTDYQSRVTFHNRIYPQNNQYSLGLLYKFC